jgi:4-amino-4-deoxy-L-arabinose transferase-like glycosyltransferase
MLGAPVPHVPMSAVVPETRVARSTDRIFALPEHARQRPRAALAIVLGLAAVVYLAGLGRSSLFIDEVFSWNASRHGLSGVGEAVRGAEVTPPLYYVLLHFWLALTGASGEAALRLPSALAGIGFVGAVCWFGTVVDNRRTGLTAAALAAISPLALQYAQEVRAYIFVMLAVTIAAAAVVKLAQEPERRRWLAIAIVAGAVSVFLHYTAALVLGPLAVWLLYQRAVPVRVRLAVVAAFALPLLALAPLLATQLGEGHHNTGVDAYARITSTGLLRLVATPFDGRAIDGMMITYQLGFLALVDAVALLAMADRFRHDRARWLLVGACALPVVAIIGVSATINPFAITRYTAVATPFMLVTIAVVAWRVPRTLGIGLLVVSVVASVIGIVAAQTPNGQWPDLRTALHDTAQRAERGDVIVGLNNVQFAGSNDYYGKREEITVRGFPSTAQALAAPVVRRALRRDKHVFLVSWPPVPASDLANAHVRADRRFAGIYRVQVAELGK